MNKIDIISAGPGSPEFLTEAARNALLSTDMVFCLARYRELLPFTDSFHPLLPLEKTILDIDQMLKGNLHPAVIVSGDAGLYSMLEMLSQHFGKEHLNVIPGISSIQAFCAAMGIPWQNAKILSAHGRPLSPSALCYYAATNECVLLLLDQIHNPAWVQKSLENGALGNLSLTIGERISYPDESIAPYEDRSYDTLSVACIQNPEPQQGLPFIGLSDDAFLRGKVPMTKREVRIQILTALELTKDAVIWDIGAGTGSVSIECARQCPLGQVYSIEQSEEAISLLHQNRDKFHLQNMEVIHGHAPDAFYSLPTPTHIFLGGSGGSLSDILLYIDSLNSTSSQKIHLVATAVTLENAQVLITAFSKYSDFSAIQLSVSRLAEFSQYHLFQAQNPVFLFSATLDSGKENRDVVSENVLPFEHSREDQ